MIKMKLIKKVVTLVKMKVENMIHILTSINIRRALNVILTFSQANKSETSMIIIFLIKMNRNITIIMNLSKIVQMIDVKLICSFHSLLTNILLTLVY